MKRVVEVSCNGRSKIRLRFELVTQRYELTRDEVEEVAAQAADKLVEAIASLPYHRRPHSTIRVRGIL